MDQDFLNELEALEDEAVGAFAVPSVEELDKLRTLRNTVAEEDTEFSDWVRVLKPISGVEDDED